MAALAIATLGAIRFRQFPLVLFNLARLDAQPAIALESLKFVRAHPERLPPFTARLMDWRVLGSSQKILTSDDVFALKALAQYASAGQQEEEWRVILLKLANGTPAREQALTCLGWRGDPRNLAYLGEELFKDDDAVAYIAYNLVRNYGQEGEAYVRRCLEQCPNMRAKFMSAQQFIQRGKPEGFKFYLENLDRNNGKMRGQIYQEMRSWVTGGRELKERDLAAFLAARASGEVKDDGRWKAIRQIGEEKDKSKIPVLISALSDPDQSVRGCAVRALHDMGVQEAVKPVLDMLSHETVGGVIEQSTLFIRKFNVKEALPILRKLANHRDPQTRIWVLQAIGQFGLRDDVGCVASYLNTLSGYSAAEVLGNMTHQDFGIVRQGISGGQEIGRAKDWWDQHSGEYPACAWGLSDAERNQADFLANLSRQGTPPDTNKIQRLIKLVDGDDRGVRFSAMDALRRAQSPEAIPTFVRLLDDYDHHIRYSAMMSLCEMNSPGGRGCPSTILYDKDPEKYKIQWKSWWEQKKKKG